MMRVYVVPLALLFIAFTAPTIAQTGEVASSPAPAAAMDPAAPRDLIYYDLFQPLRLNCTWPDSDVEYKWFKNGTLVEPAADGKGAAFEAGGAELVYRRALEDDYGNYSCVIGDSTHRAWDVRARTVARLPPNSNVVEGQKLSLVCKLHGKPAPPVQWRYSPGLALSNDTGELIITDGPDARFTTKESAAGVVGGVLELAAAARADAGVYWCAAGAGAGEGTRAGTVLRVKDVYAALWPFLGICLEVFVLCAIILVYEKRRTKPEMDDSDADAHDQ